MLNWIREKIFPSRSIAGEEKKINGGVGHAIFFVIACILALAMIKEVCAPILASLVIAYLLYPLVKKLTPCRVPKILAVLIVFVIFIGAFAIFILWLFPLIWNQLINLAMATPDLIKQSQISLEKMQSSSVLVTKVVNFLADELRLISVNVGSYISDFGKTILSFSVASFGSLISVSLYIFLVPAIVFIFLKDAELIKNWFGQFFRKEDSVVLEICKEMHVKIGSYLKGRLIEMLIMFLLLAMIFTLLKLRYALLLSAIVGVSVFLPYIGLVVASIPVVILAFIDWGCTLQFVYILSAYGAAILFDACILSPFLFAEALEIHPVVIILSVFLFGSYGGIWGMFFAIPLVTLINIVLKRLRCDENGFKK